MQSGALAPWLLLLANARGSDADCSADGDNDAADGDDSSRERNAHCWQPNNNAADCDNNRHCDRDPLRQHCRAKAGLVNNRNIVINGGRGHGASVCGVDAIGG